MSQHVIVHSASLIVFAGGLYKPILLFEKDNFGTSSGVATAGGFNEESEFIINNSVSGEKQGLFSHERRTLVEWKKLRMTLKYLV